MWITGTTGHCLTLDPIEILRKKDFQKNNNPILDFQYTQNEYFIRNHPKTIISCMGLVHVGSI
jgi:hypothetical protein